MSEYDNENLDEEQKGPVEQNEDDSDWINAVYGGEVIGSDKFFDEFLATYGGGPKISNNNYSDTNDKESIEGEDPYMSSFLVDDDEIVGGEESGSDYEIVGGVEEDEDDLGEIVGGDEDDLGEIVDEFIGGEESDSEYASEYVGGSKSSKSPKDSKSKRKNNLNDDADKVQEALIKFTESIHM